MKIDIKEIEKIYKELTYGEEDRLAVPLLFTDMIRLASKHGLKTVENLYLLQVACKVIQVVIEDEDRKQERDK